MEKDQKDIQQYEPKHVQELWVEMLNNSVRVRNLVFNKVFKGESKQDIQESVKDWDNLTEEEKDDWVNDTLSGGDDANLFIDLLITLKTYKNPKKSLKIWKENNNLK